LLFTSSARLWQRLAAVSALAFLRQPGHALDCRVAALLAVTGYDPGRYVIVATAEESYQACRRRSAAATPGARAPRTVIARRRSRRGNPEVLRFAWSMWRKMARGGDWIAASAAPPRNDQRAGVCRLPDETLSKSDSGTQPLRCLGCICFILRATPRQAIEDRLLAETLREGELKQVV
jgi:hypothetical protein